jgi:hypothetical protein
VMLVCLRKHSIGAVLQAVTGSQICIDSLDVFL